jgi:hypothetical protein
MNAAEMEVVSQFPFKLRRMATTIEAHIGQIMLKAERADGHVAGIPKDMGANFGAARLDPDFQRKKAIQVAELLKGKPPMGREQIAALLNCSKETAGGRAAWAVKMGLLKKVSTGTFNAGQPTLTYQAVGPIALTPSEA